MLNILKPTHHGTRQMASPLTFKCHMLRARNNVHEIPYHVSRTLDCQKQGGSCEETTRHGTVEAVSKNWTQKYANGTADVDKSCAIRNARYRQPGEIIGRVSRNPDNICFPASSRVYQGVMLLFSLYFSPADQPVRSAFRNVNLESFFRNRTLYLET